jgi:Holliday junction resolvase-like predicted endonuclease
MQANFLEELVAEWYEYQGYLVKRNERVERNPNGNGGYRGELDVVAFRPTTDHLVHVEVSMDADSWGERKERLQRKFLAGAQNIHRLFDGLPIDGKKIEQVAVFVGGSKTNHKKVGSATVQMVDDLIVRILHDLKGRPLMSRAVPEKYPILRTLQMIAEYRKRVTEELKES